jgi:hypothetical protein
VVADQARSPRARIIDPRGQLLAEAALYSSDDGATHLLAGLQGKDRLLGYYFLNSGRQVHVQLGDDQFGGRLRTRWHGGGRHWLVLTPNSLS